MDAPTPALLPTNQSVNTLIVFGEGPVKPVLLASELTPDQHIEWKNYKENPLRYEEPNFWCMNQRKYLVELEKIDSDPSLTTQEREYKKEIKRQEWQYDGWFALKQWGRQNALAAGSALYEGKAKEVILTGGKTIPAWAKKILPKRRLENWPTEAELMKNIIKSFYGNLYGKKYAQPIDVAIRIENTATNTIENFVYSINMNPRILHAKSKIGLLSADYHLQRLVILAGIFSLPEKNIRTHSAQRILQSPDSSALIDPKQNALLKKLYATEKRWIKGLTHPKYVTYWLGYIGLVKHPRVIQNAIHRLTFDPWKEVAVEAFNKVNLKFEDYQNENLVELLVRNPAKYKELVHNLQMLKTAEHRLFPNL